MASEKLIEVNPNDPNDNFWIFPKTTPLWEIEDFILVNAHKVFGSNSEAARKLKVGIRTIHRARLRHKGEKSLD